MNAAQPDQENQAGAVVGTKRCAKCTATLPTANFRKSSWHGHKDGLIPYCRECERARDRARVKQRALPDIPSTHDLRIAPEYSPNQMTKKEARTLFHYEPRNGDLLWLNRKERGWARVMPKLHDLVLKHDVRFPAVQIEGKHYRLHVLIWNWHHGKTDWPIEWKDGNRLNNHIENLREVAGLRTYEKPEHHLSRFEPKIDPRHPIAGKLDKPIRCPCCLQQVWRPTLPVIVDMCDLSGLEVKVFGAIWRGGGRVVMSEEIFNVMYEDDDDGGPEAVHMRRALTWQLFHLRKKLEGSGVSIETVGYRRGFRLVMGNS